MLFLCQRWTAPPSLHLASASMAAAAVNGCRAPRRVPPIAPLLHPPPNPPSPPHDAFNACCRSLRLPPPSRALSSPPLCHSGRCFLSRAKRFEAEVVHELLSSVHHPSSSPNGSFFMLVVFCHYLFQLTEDSLAMPLHYCLGVTCGISRFL
jgi:hypothetical protein